MPAFVVVASAAAQLGLAAEASAAVQAILRIDPAYGDHVVADLRSRNVHPEIIAVMVEGLRLAGLPGQDTSMPADGRAAPPRRRMMPPRLPAACHGNLPIG